MYSATNLPSASNDAATSRMASLDVLRWLAAFMVLAYHYLYRGAVELDPTMSTAYPKAAEFAVFGFVGLHLFFMISGFVIAWSAQKRDFLDFAIARAIRIYPAFVLCMGVTFVAMLAAANPIFPASAEQFVANLAIVAPAFGQPFMDGVYWTIVLEIVFYGWFALLIIAGLADRHLVAVAAFWLAAAVANEQLLHLSILRVALLTQYLPFFLCGVLAYRIMRDSPRAETLVVWGVSFAITFLVMAGLRADLIALHGTTLGLAPLMAVNAATHAIFLAGLAGAGLFSPSRWTLLLGGITYPLYLLHQQIGYVAIDALAPTTGNWPAFAIVTLAVTAASAAIYVFWERPLQARLKLAWHAVRKRFSSVGAIASA
jgi:peptidoglycan/LPS O-acetylase OafA/YrhL